MDHARHRPRARRVPQLGLALARAAGSGTVRTRDVPVEAGPRRRLRPREPNALERRKAAEIADLLEEGKARIGALSERDLLIAGAALYAGEGTKRDGIVNFANSDPAMIVLFCAWLRRFFPIDEGRLRVRLYLHEGLDLFEAQSFWSEVTAIPLEQFAKPYRAIAKAGIRHNKHQYGCVSIRYACTRTHRGVMGLVGALLGSTSIPG